MNLIDTHAHLDSPTSLSNGELRGASTDDIQGIIGRAREAGVNKIICVGTSIEASKKCVEIAQTYSTTDLQIYATVGIHSQDGKGDVEKSGSLSQCIDTLSQMVLSSKKIVGIGECGLDYYLDSDPSSATSSAKATDVKKASEGKPETSDQEKKFQGELFGAQIKLAQELDLPLVVHCRNGWEEIFDLISKFKDQSSKLIGVFHSWTGDWEAAGKALDLGFYISFSGIVTFKNAPKVQEAAKKIPLEKMLVETDSPFLSPEPLRGSKNEPKNVRIVAEFLASLRNLPINTITDATRKNAEKLFKFK